MPALQDEMPYKTTTTASAATGPAGAPGTRPTTTISTICIKAGDVCRITLAVLKVN